MCVILGRRAIKFGSGYVNEKIMSGVKGFRLEGLSVYWRYLRWRKYRKDVAMSGRKSNDSLGQWAARNMSGIYSVILCLVTRNMFIKVISVKFAYAG